MRGGGGEGKGLRITSFMSCRQFSVPCSTLQLLPCMKVFSWLGKFCRPQSLHNSPSSLPSKRNIFTAPLLS